MAATRADLASRANTAALLGSGQDQRAVTTQEDSAPLLAVEHLTMRFGGLTAVDDVSFSAYRDEITAVIGPNGAGKTTVFNCLTGFYKPSAGSLIIHGSGEALRLDRLQGFRIARRAR